MELMNRDGLNGIRSGYWTIDKMTGGIGESDLIVISSEEGGGKTTLCLNMMARQLSLGYKVCFISLDMRITSIEDRLWNIIGDKATYGKLVREDNFCTQASRSLPLLSLRYVMENAKEFGVDIVYLDNIQCLLKDDSYVFEQLYKVTRELKTLANIYRISVVAISEKGQLDRAADKCLVLRRTSPPHFKSNSLGVRIAKNRNDANFWEVSSGAEFLMDGFDIEEPDYSIELDRARSYGDEVKPMGSEVIRFREGLNSSHFTALNPT